MKCVTFKSGNGKAMIKKLQTWGGGRRENADNCNWTAIKKKKKKLLLCEGIATEHSNFQIQKRVERNYSKCVVKKHWF